MKKFAAILCAVLATFAALIASNHTTAIAETEQSPLRPSYTLEIDENGKLALPTPEGNTKYKVNVYRASDTGLKNPLYENVSGEIDMKYTGSFPLKYVPENGVGEELFTRIGVSDKIAPTLEISDLKEKYYKGDKTNFTVSYADNVDEGESLIYTLRVWFGEEETAVPYNGAIQDDGQVHFDVKGKYRLIFTVRDSSDNSVVAEYDYNVKVDGFDFSIFIPVIAIALMLTMFFLPIVIVIRTEFGGKQKKR